MDFITILFIAVGLAMDAFAISVTKGIVMKSIKVSNSLMIAIFFGSFQAIMPVIGWFAGLSFKTFISKFDHWIAFGLLVTIGIKMIYEAGKIKESEKSVSNLSIFVLFMLSIATSIDALAVGLSFAFLDISIITPAIVIGFITFILSFLGVFIGNRFGHLFEKKIEVVGGTILIAIGAKILFNHLGYL